MIEDSPIVAETRKIRQAISAQFHHNVDRYFDYLREKSHADDPGNKHAEGKKAKRSAVAD